MAQNARSTRITAAYVELKKLVDAGNYSKIIKATNKIVNDDHNQPEAWQCRVAAHIQLDQFKEAINSVAKASNKQQLQFELAYCHYRLNNVAAALSTLDGAPDKDSARGKELRAQILYRLEQHSECYSVYRELVRTTADDMDMERSTNMAAVQVHRVMQGQCPAPPAPSAPSSSYEQWYNSGCAAAAAGDLQQALQRLQQASSRCVQLLQEEGASDEELQQELAIIRVQHGYVLQCEGREKEAASEYSKVLQHKLEDPALLAILHNNMAVSNRDANVFDTRKKMKATQVSELEHKLTSSQRHELTLNNCILAHQSQQSMQEEATIEAECSRLLADESCTSETVRLKGLLLLACSEARAGKLEQAVGRLQAWQTTDHTQSTLLRLAAAQLRLMKSDVSGGISELSQLPASDQYRAGVVASIVTLLNAKKNKPAVAKLFKEAAAWHQQNKENAPSKSTEQLLRRASEFHMKEGDPQSAAAALEQLRGLSDEAAAACLPSLIHAYSQFNSSAAQALSRDLPTTALPAAVDADVLEASLGPKYFMKGAHKTDDKQGPVAAAADQAKEAAAGGSSGGGRVKPRKKKRRKTVLPKGYIEGVTPDPERWLPRWQRKTGPGSKRRRDKRKDVGKGTQGGAGETADKYDISKNPGQYRSSAAVQQQPEPAGPRRNMPKKKTNRKK